MALHVAKFAFLGKLKSRNHLRLVNVGDLICREPTMLQVLRVVVCVCTGLLDLGLEPSATILGPLDEPCVPV